MAVREKYGDILSGSSSESSSDEEDEDGEGITSDVERDFLRTLSLIKNKDPAIYDASTTFYGMCTTCWLVRSSLLRAALCGKQINGVVDNCSNDHLRLLISPC